MTERNDDGTFAPAEPMTGQLGVEADAGFRQMLETTPKDEPEVSNLESEAANLAIAHHLRGEGEPQDEQLSYLKPDGSPEDPNKTVPLDRAAKDLSAYHGAQEAAQIQTASSDLARQVDALRAAALRENPALAEHFGVNADEVLAKAEAVEKATEQTAQAEETSAPLTPGLDPEVEKAMRLPQVREAIENELAESHQARAQYTNALATANQFARAAFAEVVPEIASLPAEHIEGALNLLQQTNPQRFAVAMNTLTRVAQIQNEQNRLQQQQTAARQQQLDAFYHSESAKFEAMIGDKSKIEAAAPELIAYAAELGIDRQTLAHFAKTEPIMQHSAFQRMMYDAVQYRLSQKQAGDWKSKAAPPSLPPVQKPGMRSGVRADSNSSQLAALEKQLDGASGNKALKISAQLLALKRTAANR